MGQKIHMTYAHSKALLITHPVHSSVPTLKVVSTSWATHLVALFQLAETCWSAPHTKIVVVAYGVARVFPNANSCCPGLSLHIIYLLIMPIAGVMGTVNGFLGQRVLRLLAS